MNDAILRRYIASHIEATTKNHIFFSWHGGEPMLAGLDFFRNVVQLQQELNSTGKPIVNGIQTNGSLLSSEWIHFLESNSFILGLSVDGPPHLHNRTRLTGKGDPTFSKVEKAIGLLRKSDLTFELLCTVNGINSHHPGIVYDFLRECGSGYITFLPVVERDATGKITEQSVDPEVFGEFLCTVFDSWKTRDSGNISVQIFDEAISSYGGRPHSLCIFREVCGGVPVVESDGEFYHCDHYVNADNRVGNIMERSLASLLDSESLLAFGRYKKISLPQECLKCEVLMMCNGACPKNRFIPTSPGDFDINYLCRGYRRFFNHVIPFSKLVAGLA